jgi:uncharacterized protein
VRDIARDQLLAELLALKPEFERKAVKRVALFGSRARNDNRVDSDVDLLIDVDETRKFSLLDLVGVGHLVEDHIGLPASVVIRRDMSPGFERRARRDEVMVF